MILKPLVNDYVKETTISESFNLFKSKLHEIKTKNQQKKCLDAFYDKR